MVGTSIMISQTQIVKKNMTLQMEYHNQNLYYSRHTYTLIIIQVLST